MEAFKYEGPSQSLGFDCEISKLLLLDFYLSWSKNLRALYEFHLYSWITKIF